MYVPTFDAILRNLNLDPKSFADADDVQIPKRLFQFLLQIAVAHAEFDGESYDKFNPDVTEAVKTGAIKDARLHYIMYGYFEGRAGGGAKVDEKWYRQRYPDVAAAIKSGAIRSGLDHFYVAGAAEWRSPSQTHQPDVAEWKNAFLPKGDV